MTKILLAKIILGVVIYFIVPTIFLTPGKHDFIVDGFKLWLFIFLIAAPIYAIIWALNTLGMLV